MLDLFYNWIIPIVITITFILTFIVLIKFIKDLFE